MDYVMDYFRLAPAKIFLNYNVCDYLFQSNQGSTLTFEGTCQVRQVNILTARHDFDLPCKKCDRMNMKMTFLCVLYLYH